jgi:hypothetical protein
MGLAMAFDIFPADMLLVAGMVGDGPGGQHGGSNRLSLSCSRCMAVADHAHAAPQPPRQA